MVCKVVNLKNLHLLTGHDWSTNCYMVICTVSLRGSKDCWWGSVDC